METLNTLFTKFQEFFLENPDYVWLLIAVVLIPLGIGNMRGKKWAVDPANAKQRIVYDLIGKNLFGKILGIIFFLAGIMALALFVLKLVV